MTRYLWLFAAVASVGACSSSGSRPSVSMTPAGLLDIDIDLIGVTAGIPHRQYLGETSTQGATRAPIVYRWLTEHTLLERGSTDTQISVPDLQRAGLPMLDEGTELDFVGGMYRDVRYRLGGTLMGITISRQYDVRLTVEWQLYDAESESMVFTGSTSGFARGSNLGLTGIQPNAMLDSFEDCLGNLIQHEGFPAATADVVQG